MTNRQLARRWTLQPHRQAAVPGILTVAAVAQFSATLSANPIRARSITQMEI